MTGQHFVLGETVDTEGSVSPFSTHGFHAFGACVFQFHCKQLPAARRGVSQTKKSDSVLSVTFPFLNTGNTEEGMFLDNPVWLHGKRKEGNQVQVNFLLALIELSKLIN